MGTGQPEVLQAPKNHPLGEENVRSTVASEHLPLVHKITANYWSKFNNRATTSHSANYIRITWRIINTDILIPLGVLDQHTSHSLK